MSELNIYQKLVEVRKSCQYLKKDNQGHQFKFVSSSQTLGTLRTAMDEHNLLLVPSVTSHETRDHTTKNGGREYFTIATMNFTWVNADKPEEKVSCPWLGQGLDSGEKGVGKAMTYAEKYFLLKFFNIATDKDDPDSFQKKSGKGKKSLPKPLPEKSAIDRCITKMKEYKTVESFQNYLDRHWSQVEHAFKDDKKALGEATKFMTKHLNQLAEKNND